MNFSYLIFISIFVQSLGTECLTNEECNDLSFSFCSENRTCSFCRFDSDCYHISIYAKCKINENGFNACKLACKSDRDCDILAQTCNQGLCSECISPEKCSSQKIHRSKSQDDSFETSELGTVNFHENRKLEISSNSTFVTDIIFYILECINIAFMIILQISGKDKSLIFTQISFLQFISSSILFNTNLIPSKIKLYSNLFQLSTFNFIVNPFGLTKYDWGIDQKFIDQNIIGVSTYDMGGFLIFLGFLIIFEIIVYSIRKFTHYDSLKRILNSRSERLISFFIFTSYSTALWITCQFKTTNLSYDFANTLSWILALLFSISLVISLIISFPNNFSNFASPGYRSKIKDELEKSTSFPSNFLFIFLFKNIFSASSLVLLFNYPLAQILIQFSLSVIYGFMFLKFKPMPDPKDLALQLSNEVAVILSRVIYGIYYWSENQEITTMGLNVIIWAIITVNTVFLLIKIWVTLRQYKTSKRKNNPKIHRLEQNTQLSIPQLETSNVNDSVADLSNHSFFGAALKIPSKNKDEVLIKSKGLIDKNFFQNLAPEFEVKQAEDSLVSFNNISSPKFGSIEKNNKDHNQSNFELRAELSIQSNEIKTPTFTINATENFQLDEAMYNSQPKLPGYIRKNLSIPLSTKSSTSNFTSSKSLVADLIKSLDESVKELELSLTSRKNFNNLFFKDKKLSIIQEAEFT